MTHTTARVAAVLVVSLAATATASGATEPPRVSDAAVRRCVEQNLPRYNTPGSAAIAQYIDLVAACRSALARESEADIEITPIAAPTRPRGSPGSRPARAGEPAAPAAPRSTRPTPQAKAAPTRAKRTRPAKPPAVSASPEPGRKAVAQAVALAVERADASPETGGIDGAPGAVSVLVGASLLIALVGVAMGVRRRLR